MIDRAFEWAKANNRMRTNSIHGEEEIKITLTETFELENTNSEETTRSGNFEVQVRVGGQS